MSAHHSRQQIWAWAFYDWANSGFATVVLAGFFPLVFQDYWSAAVDPAQANLRLGFGNGTASLLIVLLAPLMGAMADRAGTKKRALLGFALAASALTAAFALVPAGEWVWALTLFVLASVGFMAANLFYDALLISVAPASRWHAVSGFGFAMGYLGGGLLYLGCVIAALQPQWFGFDTAINAALAAFVITGLWWAVFSLPLALMVREPPARQSDRAALAGGLKQLWQTLTHLRARKAVWMFLIAYWLYIDAVGTTIRMAVAYGRSLGFEQSDLIVALLITQFVGFPAALLMGWLGQRIGPRQGILIGIGVYIGICLWAAFIQSAWEFFAIAALVGLVQGGVQALSRSLYAGLIPAERAGEFFGFYNLLGKFAALIGPPLFGLFGVWFGDVRYSMLALILLFLAGAIMLTQVQLKERDDDTDSAPA